MVFISPAAPNEKSFKIAIWANNLFERHRFHSVINEYTRVFACYIKTGEYEKAKDAIKAIELARCWSKMGIKIMPGRDTAIEKNVLNPIQTKLFEFAAHMKNIIHRYTIVATIVTHHHFDHVGGSPPASYDSFLPVKISGLSSLLKKIPNIKACIHPLEIPFLTKQQDIPLNRLVPTTTADVTNTLTVGKVHIDFVHTPGYTPGSRSSLINQSRLIAGDTLLCGGHCGRTDFRGGDRKAMEKTLRDVLGRLDVRNVVYPGRNYGVGWSTIGIERNKGCLEDELVGFGYSQ
ncbi:MAG: beta-lactamase-like protein [Benjaminiella poitrasii]|nr:MAG: beta-lactamase-like protein [Benjaminiella poitrasii]